jgi:hypothetical protein
LPCNAPFDLRSLILDYDDTDEIVETQFETHNALKNRQNWTVSAEFAILPSRRVRHHFLGRNRMVFRFGISFALVVCLFAPPLRAQNRTLDGNGNNLSQPLQGAANTPFIRFNYSPQYQALPGTMIGEPTRPNARDVSNLIFAQPGSKPSARNLSNYIWAWGQFLTHDTDLSTSSHGADINGDAPIIINSPIDPLGPAPIPFTRADFQLSNSGSSVPARIPVNEVTSYIDASAIYGSNATRAAALRTDGGLGAKLITDSNNLLPRNTAGLPNENNGPVPGSQLFLAGDIRSNENSLLTSIHTVFAREHNRLVDRIAIQQPLLSNEEQYQLARRLVGAEMQAITYREFLPALLGNATTVPKAEQYLYSPTTNATITTAHAFGAFRFGHSAVTSQLNLVDNDGTPRDSLELRDVFFNPNLIGNNPQLVDQLLVGAAAQVSEEIDGQVVDDLRNFLFGPPGAGGLDLVSLNIQRSRDVGLPVPGSLTRAYGFSSPSSFTQLTSDIELAGTLATLYLNTSSLDTWVAGLVQDHMPGSSVGNIFQRIIENQFRRLRDGDRLFYRGNAAGLYVNGTQNADIASLVDLDHVTLADILLANTSIDFLPKNVFFVPKSGDYTGDGLVDAADYIMWRRTQGTSNVWADGNRDGVVDADDYSIWAANFGSTPASGNGTAVPEPTSAVMTLLLITAAYVARQKTAR